MSGILKVLGSLTKSHPQMYTIKIQGQLVATVSNVASELTFQLKKLVSTKGFLFSSEIQFAPIPTLQDDLILKNIFKKIQNPVITLTNKMEIL